MPVIEIAENDCVLKIRRGFLVISRKDKEPAEIPFDLIDSIVVTAEGLTYTNNTLRKLCEEGIPLIICGSNFQPLGILSGITLYHKLTQRLKNQIDLKKTVSKQLWTTIVKQKIKHQLYVLNWAGKETSDIYNIARRIKSGDPDNIEAQAARRYWERLFGYRFIRNPDEKGINSFLNYGYAILRGSVSRYVVGSGLHPSLGIHHRNKLNPFCLVDDIMEPFRPIVDKTVFCIFGNNRELKELVPAYKKQLAEILSFPLKINGTVTDVTNGIQKFVWSFVNSIQENKNLLIDFDIR